MSRHSDSTVISDIGTDGKDEHFTLIASPPYPAGIELVACPLLLDFLNPVLEVRAAREWAWHPLFYPMFKTGTKLIPNTDEY